MLRNNKVNITCKYYNYKNEQIITFLDITLVINNDKLEYTVKAVKLICKQSLK